MKSDCVLSAPVTDPGGFYALEAVFAKVLSRVLRFASGEKPMKQAALGFRAHSGWTAVVAVSLGGRSPEVLLRARPHLVRTFSFEFRQPYHTAEKAPPGEADAFIRRVRTEARNLAYEAIRSAQREIEASGYRLKHCGLLVASGKPLPDLTHILASHALIHAADGELFREALRNASERCGCEVFTTKEKDVLERSSLSLGKSRDEIVGLLASLGSAVGPPWSQDEKLAALVAWLSLVSGDAEALEPGRRD